ncbi:hypothetical protein HMPREF9108_02382 [Leptotrichia sp. oral taxon 225 str. F0581]|nr:hypothetical protein HMPREF9108_02382 [Leptotrichia sp. oral taxon 225 str. F0581]
MGFIIYFPKQNKTTTTQWILMFLNFFKKRSRISKIPLPNTAIYFTKFTN